MNRAYLLLGSNLGDRMALLEKAREMTSQVIGEIHDLSSVYESEPWGFTSENNFLNQVVLVDTPLEPEDLLESIHTIERTLGRRRMKNSGYQSRPIDVDILFFNDSVIHRDDLDIPHPRLHERRFTLVPLCEMDENYIHPGLNKTVKQLLKECKDTGQAKRYNEQE